MNKKNIKDKRAFIPQSIGDTVKKINRNFTSKFGKIEFIIHSNWSKIVGSYFSNYTEPKNITRIPDYENDLGVTIYKNYLKVGVTPAVALEFQHFKSTIIEKINSYFGYKAITDLRIHQNYLFKKYDSDHSKKIKQTISHMEQKSIIDKVKPVEHNGLKNSLIDLGVSIKKGDK